MGADEWRAILAAVAVAIALVSLLVTFREKRRQRHATLISALQGEKEAVAFIAFMLRNHTWGGRRRDRLELLSALVVAWIFENSDRARAMIHSAVKAVHAEYAADVLSTIDDIQEQLESYARSHYSQQSEQEKRVGKYLDKLKGLRGALERGS